jgi:hypothetical protein
MKQTVILVFLAAGVLAAQNFHPDIPTTWDSQALADLQLPLAHVDASPQLVDADTYSSIPVAPIYKSYPVYHPDKEPPGYLDWLRRQEPEIVVPAEGLAGAFKTKADWIRAGKLIFDTQLPPFVPLEMLGYLRDRQFYEDSRTPLTSDGVMPFLRYVVREKGHVEVSGGCSMCHTRVLPDGTVIRGAQGNNTLGAQNAYILRNTVLKAPNPAAVLARLPILNPATWLAPWLEPDPNARIVQVPPASQPAVWEAMPPGVLPRHSGLVYPAAIPDLIGLKDRRYFDRTGFIQHRSIADLMRYASLTAGIDRLNTFGKYIPAKIKPSRLTRHSDEHLYALALYVYSLEPPPNPNLDDPRVPSGREVFDREGCGGCHTPPLYTDNSLTPAAGFAVPEDHEGKYNIHPVRVGTDPGMALKTRRGTGYYKVPSLKGVWYRGPLGHDGSIATLEDWLDPARLRDDYTPTGFRGYGVTHRAVPGHEFGLDLAAEDKAALIAFLKTL